MALICFLIFANAEITLNKNGFSYHSHLFTRSDAGQDYYTKSEVRDLLKAPVNVRMEPGLTYDEMTSPRAQEQATDPNEDIDYWAIEVN